MSIVRRVPILVLAVVLALGTSGCATNVAQWIARTRDHQGDVALAHRNLPDASIAYQLALRIDPHDVHARDGFTSVQIRLAQSYFAASRFDEAIDALALAAKYSPNDDRVAGLRNEIEQAEIKRDIVVSNYPAYRLTGFSLRRSYAQLRTQLQAISTSLQRFDYTYDTADLSAGIRQSRALSQELSQLTGRLVQYRQLVESGAPESEAETLAPPASLLPLP